MLFIFIAKNTKPLRFSGVNRIYIMDVSCGSCIFLFHFWLTMLPASLTFDSFDRSFQKRKSHGEKDDAKFIVLP
jgi:hypothetical protein